MNLSTAAKTTRLSNAVAAGTTDIEASSVNTTGFEGHRFTFLFGAITASAVTSCKIQGSHDDVAWEDLEGTAVTVPDDGDNKLVILDVGYSQHKFLRPVVDRGTQNAVLDGIICDQYLADAEPVTHGATVIAAEFHHAPAEGTA